MNDCSLLSIQSKSDRLRIKRFMEVSSFEHQRYIGKSFGNYQILSYLGGTSLYHSFKAFSLEGKKVVNLKIFNALVSLQENDAQLITNNLRKASILRHPNIVQLLSFDHFHGYPYSVSEFIDGMTLKKAMSKEAFHQRCTGPELEFTHCIQYCPGIGICPPKECRPWQRMPGLCSVRRKRAYRPDRF